MKKHDFYNELKRRFPKISNDLGGFLKNPERDGFVINNVKKGIKHDLLYYIVADKRLNLANTHSFNPSYIFQVVAQILVPKNKYKIDMQEIEKFFRYEIKGQYLDNPLFFGADNQEDQDHLTISIGYSSEVNYPSVSLQSKMKRLSKLIHNQRVR